MKLDSNPIKHLQLAVFGLFFSQFINGACPVACPTLTGPAHFCNVLVDNNLNTQNLCATGNVQIGGSLSVCGPEHIFNTGASTGCTNGALVVDGGVGVGGALNICGPVHIFNTGASTGCGSGALVVNGGVGIAGNVNICGSLSVSGPVSPGAVIPFGATIAGDVGLGILGADLGFGIAQGLSVVGIDTLSFSAPRNGLLRNLVVNVGSFVGVGSVTAEVYVSANDGASWLATGIEVTFTGVGSYHDLVDTFAVLQTDLIALRLTPSVAGLELLVSAGLEYQ